ncbi:MAG: hypothetical protein KY461_15565 [Actinobacteria bacterium]|nr:hypothetical protein [Actinomycetota bacterium]
MDPDARRRLPVPASWLQPTGRPPRWRRVAGSVLLGCLVVMTVWGFGRSGFPEHQRWFLALGIVAGAVAAVLSARRATRR